MGSKITGPTLPQTSLAVQGQRHRLTINAAVFKIKSDIYWILWSKNIFLIKKINTFQGDRTDISAEKEALLTIVSACCFLRCSNASCSLLTNSSGIPNTFLDAECSNAQSSCIERTMSYLHTLPTDQWSGTVRPATMNLTLLILNQHNLKIYLATVRSHEINRHQWW